MTARFDDLDAQGADETQSFFGGVVNAPEIFVEPLVRPVLEQQHLGQREDGHQGIDDVMSERHHHRPGFVRHTIAGVVVLRHSSGRLACGRNTPPVRGRGESKYRFGYPLMTTATIQRSDGV